MAEVKLGLNLNKLEVGLLFGAGALVLALNDKEDLIGNVERLARLALGFMDEPEEPTQRNRGDQNNRRAVDRGEDPQPYEGVEHRGGESRRQEGSDVSHERTEDTGSNTTSAGSPAREHPAGGPVY